MITQSNFLQIFNRTLNFEGKCLEKVIGDDGGETFWGISRVFNSKWIGWPIVDINPNDPQLPLLVQNFYEINYWEDNYFPSLNSLQLSAQLFDASVNLGSSRVAFAIQHILKIKCDGIFGPFTINSCNKMDENEIITDVLSWRKSHYIQRAQADPFIKKDLDGLLSRCQLASFV